MSTKAKPVTTKTAPVVPPKKTWPSRGDVTIPGPRISVGEQLTQVLAAVQDMRAVLDKFLEEADTEEYSQESDAEGEDLEED